MGFAIAFPVIEIAGTKIRFRHVCDYDIHFIRIVYHSLYFYISLLPATDYLLQTPFYIHERHDRQFTTELWAGFLFCIIQFVTFDSFFMVLSFNPLHVRGIGVISSPRLFSRDCSADVWDGELKLGMADPHSSRTLYNFSHVQFRSGHWPMTS